MKNRIIAAALAAVFMFPLLGVTAFAGGGDCYDYIEPIPEPEAVTVAVEDVTDTPGT